MSPTSSRFDFIFALITIMTLILITSICFIPVFLLGLLKLFPNQKWRVLCTKGVDQCVIIWNKFILIYINRFYPAQWHYTGDNQFDLTDWHLVIANHQSWLDIVILQKIFYKKIPVLKFFIKQELKWIPLLGFAWWVMGCPFMKRYSKEYLAKKPHLKGKDYQATQKALTLFKSYPSSIMSFIEGTRFTSHKKEHQSSPYTHLLKPKAGGMSHIIQGMGQQIKSILDVTIVYDEAKHSLWDYLCRRVHSIRIHIRTLPIPEMFMDTSTFLTEGNTQLIFREWLNEQWKSKDLLMNTMKTTPH